MFYISIFLIKETANKYKNTNHICFNDIYKSIDLSHNNLDYSINFEEFDSINDLPAQCSSDGVLITKDNILYRPTILDSIYSIANLFNDYGMICGPTKIKLNNNKYNLDKNLFSLYEYNLNFGGSKISDITGESYNYPSIYGSFIAGEIYNKCGYSITKSSRHTSAENKYFIHMLCQKSKLYYTDRLSKVIDIDCKSHDIKTIFNDYYDNGYQDGRLLFMLDEENKKKELWHRFIESPDAMNNNIPIWLLESTYDDSSDKLENLILLKCRYQIGFYEGMTNKNII